MTYAAETKAENTTTKGLLRTIKIRVLGSITGHTIYDMKRSKEIKDTCKVSDVVR